MNNGIERLLAESKARGEAMTPEETDAAVRRQIEGIVEADALIARQRQMLPGAEDVRQALNEGWS